MKPFVSVAVCEVGVVTTTSTGPAMWPGVMAVSEVELLKVTDADAVPPKVTVVPETKFEPLIETDVPPTCFCLEAANARIDEPAERSVRQFEREHAGVDAREFEEVVDERAEPSRLLRQGLDVLVRGRDPVLDGLDHRPDRRKRRAQIVTCPGNELAAGVEQILKLRRHRVEGGAELGDFRWSLFGRSRGEVAAGERARHGA